MLSADVLCSVLSCQRIDQVYILHACMYTLLFRLFSPLHPFISSNRFKKKKEEEAVQCSMGQGGVSISGRADVN